MLKLVTAPAVEPLTTAEAKSFTRVEISADDTLIDAFVKGARQYLEKTYAVALITQVWDLYLDGWPGGDTLRLPVQPVQSVGSITYTDSAGAAVVMSAADYLVDAVSVPGRIRLKSGRSWPSVTLQEMNGVVVRFTAGYGAAGSAVPEPLRDAVRLLVAHRYENREPEIIGPGLSATRLAFTIDALMASERLWAL